MEWPTALSFFYGGRYDPHLSKTKLTNARRSGTEWGNGKGETQKEDFHLTFSLSAWGQKCNALQSEAIVHTRKMSPNWAHLLTRSRNLSPWKDKMTDYRKTRPFSASFLGETGVNFGVGWKISLLFTAIKIMTLPNSWLWLSQGRSPVTKSQELSRISLSLSETG